MCRGKSEVRIPKSEGNPKSNSVKDALRPFDAANVFLRNPPSKFLLLSDFGIRALDFHLSSRLRGTGAAARDADTIADVIEAHQFAFPLVP